VVPEQLSHILSFIGSLEEESLSEDLENKICQLAEEYTLYGQSDYIRLKTVLTNLANWQKWQMMKDAKDATVIMTHVTNESMSPALSAVLLPDTFQEGDNVKVIIVPSIDSSPKESACIYNRPIKERKGYCKYCSAVCQARIMQ